MKKLIEANIEAIDQALELIRSISDDQYRDRVNGRSQPGAHIRHILDHYQSLRDGCCSGTTDYDCRRRQSAVETERSIAVQELVGTKQWLESLELVSNRVSVKSEISLGACCSVTIDSDTQRELLYVLNHTVHHIAYVSLLLQFNGVSVSETMGMAPATASHVRAAAAN